MNGIQVSEDDPALLIDWDDNFVSSFLTQLHQVEQRNMQVPLFLQNVHNQKQLKDALMAQLATVSGGRFGNSLLAPNTLVQALHVVNKLAQIEMLQVIQEIASLAYGPDDALGTIYVLPDRKIQTSAVPVGRTSLTPRKLFQ